MKTQSRKAKGRLLQQYIAHRIIELIPELEEDDVVSRSMGSSGVDLLLSPKAQQYFPISIEAKNTKERPGMPALEQASYNCYPNTTPAVVWKMHGKSMEEGCQVILKLDDFIKLVYEGNKT